MPDVVGPRITLSSVRSGLFIILLLIEIVTPRSAEAQQSIAGIFSGSVTITQPLNHTTPGNLAQQVVLDSSPSALAPWAAAGLRWGLSDWDVHPIGTLGLRWRHRPLRVTLGISRDAVYDSLSRRDQSGSGPDLIQPGYAMQPVTDVLGSLQWNAGHITVGGETGWRLAGPARQQLWYRADLATSLIRKLALVVGVDRRSDRVFASSANRLTLGLHWQWEPPGRRPRAEPARPQAASPAPPNSPRIDDDRFMVHRIQDSIRILLTLASTNASQVEVRGDFTDWMAVPLERGHDNVWQLTLAADPGVHRLAVRINGGAWRPPPGLPVGTDGYGATVGLFTVEP